MNKFEKACWSWAKKDWKEMHNDEIISITFTFQELYKGYKNLMRQFGSSIEDVRTFRDSGAVVK